MRAKQWHVEVFVSEEGDVTKARAVLFGDSPNRVTGEGFTRRNPHDPVVPEIGDEVAVARALEALSRQLVAVASVDIDASIGERVRID